MKRIITKTLIVMLLMTQVIGCTNRTENLTTKPIDLFLEAPKAKEEIIKNVKIEEVIEYDYTNIIILNKMKDDMNKLYADLLLDNSIVFSDIWDAVKIRKIRWNEDPFKHDSWLIYFQSLNFIPILIKQFEITSDDRYLEKALYYIESWISANQINNTTPSKFSWNDHAVSNRVKNFIYFISIYKDSDIFNDEVLLDLMYSLYEHSFFLVNDDNYYENNHGIMQDQALFELFLLLGDLPESSTWFEKAEERLLNSIHRDVSVEGVHKEHSPFYHVYVQTLFKQTKNLLGSYDINIEQLDYAIESMNEYNDYIVTPSGNYPQFSDTRKEENEFSSEYKEIPDKVFSDSGIAFLRGVDSTNNQDIYFSLIAAYNSKVHKHKDDLSFVLSVGETDFFIDGGNMNYNQGVERDYFVSAFAHNTIVLNNSAWLFSDDNIGNPKIDYYSLSDELSIVQASHSMYDRATIFRTIIYLKPDIFIIHDRVETENPRFETLNQIYNFGEEVEVEEIDRNTLNLISNKGNDYINLKFLDNNNVVLENYFGSEDPFLGWHSNDTDEIHPINSYIVERNIAYDKDFYSVININKENIIESITYNKNNRNYTIDDGVKSFEIELEP